MTEPAPERTVAVRRTDSPTVSGRTSATSIDAMTVGSAGGTTDITTDELTPPTRAVTRAAPGPMPRRSPRAASIVATRTLLLVHVTAAPVNAEPLTSRTIASSAIVSPGAIAAGYAGRISMRLATAVLVAAGAGGVESAGETAGPAGAPATVEESAATDAVSWRVAVAVVSTL